MPGLSVVLIIYRIEKYLPQCIESVLSQTYRDFELVLVDDGSPDRCPEICDEYAAKDPRIRVIHQENQGSVLARWNGLLASSGEYVSMIDGDDFIDPDMYSHMMSLAVKDNADIVAVGYKEDRDGVCTERNNRIGSGVYSRDSLNAFLTRALYDGVFYEPGIVPSLWSKLFRRDLLCGAACPDKSIKMGDDAAVSYPAMAGAGTIVVDNNVHPYHYRIVEGSMSRSHDELYFERAEKLIGGLYKNLSKSREMRRCLLYYALFILNIGIGDLFSRHVKKSIGQKLSIVEKTVSSMSEYIDWRGIDWSGFSRKDEKRFKALLSGRTASFAMDIYAEKTADRIKRMSGAQ